MQIFAINLIRLDNKNKKTGKCKEDDEDINLMKIRQVGMSYLMLIQ